MGSLALFQESLQGNQKNPEGKHDSLSRIEWFLGRESIVPFRGFQIAGKGIGHRLGGLYSARGEGGLSDRRPLPQFPPITYRSIRDRIIGMLAIPAGDHIGLGHADVGLVDDRAGCALGVDAVMQLAVEAQSQLEAAVGFERR
jgi:hypothetical protein